MSEQTLDQTLQQVEKTLNTPNPSGLAGSGMTLIRENLSPFISRLTDKQTPLRDRLPREQGNGEAASWNVLTAIGVGNSPFAEGGTPTEDTSTYARRTSVYKELGKKKSISDRMLAAGRSFTDQEAEQTEVAMREVIQDEEYFIVNGDTGVSALQFDGLKTLVTTNVTDDNNNALGFRTDLLDAAVALLVDTYGAVPTAVYCNYSMKRAINQSLSGDVRINLDQSNEVSTGVEVGFYQSMIGKLPIVPTFAIANDTASFPGNTVSDIYVVVEKFRGQNNLYMSDLYPLGKTMLARTGAAIQFMVNESTVLVVRAEEMVVRIKNVRVA